MTWQEQTNWKHRIRFSSEMNDRHLHDDLCTEIRIARFSGNIMVVIKGAMSSIWVIGISGPSSREGKGSEHWTWSSLNKNKTKKRQQNRTLLELVIHVKLISPPPKNEYWSFKDRKKEKGLCPEISWKTHRDLYFVLHNLGRNDARSQLMLTTQLSNRKCRVKQIVIHLGRHHDHLVTSCCNLILLCFEKVLRHVSHMEISLLLVLTPLHHT